MKWMVSTIVIFIPPPMNMWTKGEITYLFSLLVTSQPIRLTETKSKVNTDVIVNQVAKNEPHLQVKSFSLFLGWPGSALAEHLLLCHFSPCQETPLNHTAHAFQLCRRIILWPLKWICHTFHVRIYPKIKKTSGNLLCNTLEVYRMNARLKLQGQF